MRAMLAASAAHLGRDGKRQQKRLMLARSGKFLRGLPRDYGLCEESPSSSSADVALHFQEHMEWTAQNEEAAVRNRAWLLLH